MNSDKKLPSIYKERHKLKYRSTECLNCYHPLDKSEQYCPNCSQLNSTKKLAFDDFFNEFFAGIFAYDSRLYRTLGILLFKPGKISKDYIEGKRVRYANPYRFYLSASILFFLAWSFTYDFDTTFDVPQENETPREEQMRITDSILAAEGVDRPEGGLVLPVTNTTTFQDIYRTETSLDTLGYWDGLGKKLEIFYKYYDETEIRNPQAAVDSLKYEHTTSNHWLYKKTVDANRFISEPALFYDYFISKLPFIIFFYLPIFALFIWLLYIRRPFTYMEHLIFTFHNQTTWFVLYGLSINLDAILETSAVTNFTNFIFLFYLYKAFRRFYGQGRVKTILKFIIINIIFFILAIIAAAFSVLASFAIY